MRHLDVIVIGAGAMGSAAAMHLARRGKQVMVLDRFGVAHDHGSSHGITRIIRLAYFEHPSYVPLLRRAFDLWRELERDAGEQLLHVTGSIDAGPAGSRTVTGSLHSCETHGLAHQVLESRALSMQFPGFRLPDDFVGVFQPDGGFLLPERCITAHLNLADAAGADVRTHEGLIDWECEDGGPVTVETDLGTYEADRVVFATGAWTGQLLPALGPVLVPERQVLGWFDVADRDAFAPSRFPVFNLDWGGEHWYGFPEFGVPGFKIGCYHHRRERIDPETFDRGHVSSRDTNLLRSCVEACFPGADGDVLMTKTCMFTNTPDEDFILDWLPGSPNVLIASPCSGHGFKFASVIGEIVADLVISGRTAHDISRHRIGRFQV